VAPYLILATTHLGVAIIIEASLFLGGHPAAEPDLGQHAPGCAELRAGAVVARAVLRRRHHLTVLAFNCFGIRATGSATLLDPAAAGRVPADALGVGNAALRFGVEPQIR
jgi:hypothetical protein